jgi:ATP/maltotriose-dependent transcriptional regulator MalT
MARALNQTTLLPRLLVWTALIHIGRNEIDRGRAFIQEAWTLAGITKTDETLHGRMPGAVPPAAHSQVVPGVHVVIPAHIGLAAMHLAMDDFEGAIAVAESALEIVDRTGYDVWAVHRLLPVAAEASLYLRDLDRARHYGARLRSSAERFGNRLGLAWADACDALTVWLSGEPERGAEMMKLAIVELESIPFRFDAARLRRQLAGRLADMGDRDGALRELRNAWAVFDELGAERELERVRIQFREVEGRPPSRRVSGAAGLTGRELEVARAMAGNLSNKAIAKKLGIAVRTVTTHVSNIYGKLGVAHRHQVAEAVRKAELAGDIKRD